MVTLYAITIHDKTGVKVYKLSSISNLIIVGEVSTERSYTTYERPDNNII